MSEFDTIDGFPAWKKKLNELLAEGKQAVADGDVDECRAIAARLTEFTIASWPDTPEISPEAREQNIRDRRAALQQRPLW